MLLRRLRKRGRRAALSVAALGLVLLSAQGIAFQHDIDLESHAPDQVCEICITVAGLDSTDVAVLHIFAATVQTTPLTSEQPLLVFDRFSRDHPARAPPQAS